MAKKADHMEAYTCENCPHLHIEFYDRNHNIMCSAIISVDQLADMAKMLEGVVIH